MNAQDFEKLTTAIRSGELTPSQMEDVVYALHSAYVDHHDDICNQLPTNLEDVADTMVVARKNSEPLDCEDDESERRFGYVHTVANVEGVSLECVQ